MKTVRFFTCLLILCVSIFAVSPLSWSQGDTFYEKNVCAEETRPFFKNINIFLIELIFSRLQEGSGYPCDVPVDRVIVKKSSVLFRQTIKISLKSLRNSAVANAVRVQEAPACVVLMPQDEYKKNREGFMPACSGLSPPLFRCS